MNKRSREQETRNRKTDARLYVATVDAPRMGRARPAHTSRCAEKPQMETCNVPVGAYGIRPITTTHKTTRAATVATCGIETGRMPYAPTTHPSALTQLATDAAPRRGRARPAPTSRCAKKPQMETCNTPVGAYGIRPITTTHKTTRAAAIATCGIEMGRMPYAPTTHPSALTQLATDDAPRMGRARPAHTSQCAEQTTTATSNNVIARNETRRVRRRQPIRKRNNNNPDCFRLRLRNDVIAGCVCGNDAFNRLSFLHKDINKNGVSKPFQKQGGNRKANRVGENLNFIYSVSV